MTGKKRILVVLSMPWNSSLASSVTTKNLLKALYSEHQFIVLCARPSSSPQQSKAADSNEIFEKLGWRHFPYSWRVNEALKKIYSKTGHVEYQIRKLIRKFNCGSILAIYPELYVVEASRMVARELNVPLMIYLHDTIAEVSQGKPQEKEIRKFQDLIFSEPHLFFSMSDGLRDLLQNKYGLKSTALPHCYPGVSNFVAEEFQVSGQRKALYSGSIYSINKESIIRTARAAVDCGFQITCTLPEAAKVLIRSGIPFEKVSVRYCVDSKDYLELLKSHDALFMGLSWPDETTMHSDELATIFPTKTPEYLATGKPIIVHAPSDYYLSRFFDTNRCGILVSDRSHESLTKAWSTILTDRKRMEFIRSQAGSAISQFSSERVRNIFRGAIHGISNSFSCGIED